MIPKKITRKSTGKSKLRGIANLISYINAPTTRNLEEKLLYSGTRGFVFDDLETQKEEMLTLVHANARSPNPVMHYLFSWRENEQPTKEQIEELVDIFIEETGLNNHQIFWGAHQNTKNIHVHLAVNKIDVDTEKITRINNNLDIEILHKIVARAEHAQGWEATPNSRYTCDEEGNVLRANVNKMDKAIEQNVVGYERSYGEKSAIRTAQELILPMLDGLHSWEDLHTALNTMGLEYRKKGSGALVLVGDTAMKASSVSRNLSMKKMEEKLGAFEEKSIQKTKEKNDDRRQIKRNDNKKQGAQSTQVLPESGMRRMSACPLVHRNARAFQRRKRKEHRRREIEALLPSFRRIYPKIDNFLRWHGAKALSDTQIELWFKYQREKMQNYKDTVLMAMQKTMGIKNSGAKAKKQRFTDWLKDNDFSQQLDEWRYECEKNFIKNTVSNEAHEVKEMQSLESKLKELAQKGWLKISLIGSDFFKQLAIKLSFKFKLEVTNPELQNFVENEQKILRTTSMNEEQAFLEYHKAIQADKYRVTCIKIAEDGDKKAFILDKQYQVNGFTAEQLQERIKEMIHIQSKGNNIYLTPLSEHKHHILLDDMDSTKLENFLMDGFQPCVIMESSPNNYQAILTIPKLETQHDKEIANRITERLNKKYGDKNLSGCIHPHRVPNFENRKPKHRQEDNTYPLVKLIKTEQVECSKSYRLSKQLHDELQVAEKRRTEKPMSYRQDSNVSSHTAYFIHLDNIKKHLNIEDNSRVDSMIALRMRATGHSQASIQAAIKECAPNWRNGQDERKSEHRNWEDYARRTAEYAFSYAGDRDLARNEHLIDFWKKLEIGQGVRKRINLGCVSKLCF